MTEELRESVTNGVQLVLVSQQKKLPIKKSEMLKIMNIKSKDFKQAIDQVAEELQEIFGFIMTGVKILDDGALGACELDKASYFITTSQFAKTHVDYSDFQSKEVIKQAAATLVLNALYIIGRDIEEEYIWQVLTSVDMDKVCNKQEDIRKFLKTELVDPMYVNRVEVKVQDNVTFRYSWGIRAELECDKYEMLKHIAQTFRKPIESFKKHYSELLGDKRYHMKITKENRDSTAGETREVRGHDNTQNAETQEILVTQEGLSYH